MFFLPTIAPHPPDVPLSVWYEAKGSKHVKGKVVMLSSSKNKLHESIMFHKGRQEGQPPLPDFRNLFSDSLHQLTLFFRLQSQNEAKDTTHVKGRVVGNYTN